jgi:hypothetical protein
MMPVEIEVDNVREEWAPYLTYLLVSGLQKGDRLRQLESASNERNLVRN